MKKKKTKLLWGIISVGVLISIPFIFLLDRIWEQKKVIKFYSSRLQ